MNAPNHRTFMHMTCYNGGGGVQPNPVSAMCVGGPRACPLDPCHPFPSSNPPSPCWHSHMCYTHVLQDSATDFIHVAARAAAHFPMPPPPLRVMVARPAQLTKVTQVPITLVHEPLHCVPCYRPPGPRPPPPLRGWVSSHRSGTIGEALVQEGCEHFEVKTVHTTHRR